MKRIVLVLDVVAGIESRGFILGAPVAYALGVGLAVIRKAGKLPFTTHSVDYDLESAFLTLIVGGPGSFVVTADRDDQFTLAVRRKLLLEIAASKRTPSSMSRSRFGLVSSSYP